MSNVTSICGCRAVGGMPASWKRPSVVVARQRALALQHVDLDAGWLSAAVENVSLFRVGIVVLRG
jgi:hypothetical protein